MPTPFSQDQLESLSLNIDEQLKELQSSASPYGESRSKAAKEPEDLPERTPKQWKAIAEVTKEDPETFWQRFRQTARRDLCEDGGVLYAQ
ncbi:MAG: hypothetical protein D3910_23380 [Candidatus Electrothrix sp. ATG2]|nr:hypothetical protein [Candidatus Electrothrix sp. ATG2]